MAVAGPRKAARLAGLTRYFTGKLCPRGHAAERFVSTKACIVCNEAVNLKWRADNPEKTVARHLKWAADNPEKVSATKAKYYRANQAKCFVLAKHRKLSIKKRTVEWADMPAIKAIYQEARDRREAGENVVVDHIIPLNGKNVCGLHVHTNLQIICSRENAMKSNKLIEKELSNGLYCR